MKKKTQSYNNVLQDGKNRNMNMNISRRMAVIAVVVVVGSSALVSSEEANGLEFGLMRPELTIEDAESGVRIHAQSLLQVKDLLEAESWREAQKSIRRSSPLLKQDIYTIIQNKPGSERPLLRNLYSTIFNNVTKLDYAARDNDASRVWLCYNNIVAALEELLSRL